MSGGFKLFLGVVSSVVIPILIFFAFLFGKGFFVVDPIYYFRQIVGLSGSGFLVLLAVILVAIGEIILFTLLSSKRAVIMVFYFVLMVCVFLPGIFIHEISASMF